MSSQFNRWHPGTPEERFLDKIAPEPNTGCWLWMAATIGEDKGPKYIRGYFGFRGKARAAHRVSYMLFCGEIPEGQCVLHRCDVPLCVNPDHLWLGTKSDNSRDMVRKGRSFYQARPQISIKRMIQGHNAVGYAHLQGERNHAAKLNHQLARDIRRLRKSGMTIPALSKQFGVCTASIKNVLRGVTWNEQA